LEKDCAGLPGVEPGGGREEKDIQKRKSLCASLLIEEGRKAPNALATVKRLNLSEAASWAEKGNAGNLNVS